MKKKKREKNIIKDFKEFFISKPRKRFDDIPNSIKSTSQYKKYRDLLIKKDDVTFFRNWSIVIFTLTALYSLISELLHKSSFLFHIICSSIAIATFISSILLIIYCNYLNKSKKSKQILAEFEQIKKEIKNDI